MLARHRIFQVMAALIVLLALMMGPTRHVSAATDGSCYFLSPGHSGHFLDVEGGSTANGARIIQWYHTWNTNQRFKFWHTNDMPSDVWYIQSVASNKLLSVNSQVGGAPVIQWTSLNHASQQWLEIATTQVGTYRYRNVATGLYLDVQGASYAAGAPLVQWTGNLSLNQIFWRYSASC
jgi:cytochrome c